MVLLVEHPPVFTLGRNTEAHHLREGADHLRGLGAEVVEVDRGGSVTFHGPGQLVAYPIVRLAGISPLAADPGRPDVVNYLRQLETVLIATAAGCGVSAGRRPPYTGLWVGEEKLAAIGVKVAGGVTTHGIALNVSTDLSWFGAVIPCGIENSGVTSLQRLGGAPMTITAVGRLFLTELARAWGAEVEAASDNFRALVEAECSAGDALEGVGFSPRLATTL